MASLKFEIVIDNDVQFLIAEAEAMGRRARVAIELKRVGTDDASALPAPDGDVFDLPSDQHEEISCGDDEGDQD